MDKDTAARWGGAAQLLLERAHRRGDVTAAECLVFIRALRDEAYAVLVEDQEAIRRLRIEEGHDQPDRERPVSPYELARLHRVGQAERYLSAIRNRPDSALFDHAPNLYLRLMELVGELLADEMAPHYPPPYLAAAFV